MRLEATFLRTKKKEKKKRTWFEVCTVSSAVPWLDFTNTVVFRAWWKLYSFTEHPTVVLNPLSITLFQTRGTSTAKPALFLECTLDLTQSLSWPFSYWLCAHRGPYSSAALGIGSYTKLGCRGVCFWNDVFAEWSVPSSSLHTKKSFPNMVPFLDDYVYTNACHPGILQIWRRKKKKKSELLFKSAPYLTVPPFSTRTLSHSARTVFPLILA